MQCQNHAEISITEKPVAKSSLGYSLKIFFQRLKCFFGVKRADLSFYNVFLFLVQFLWFSFDSFNDVDESDNEREVDDE